MSFGLHEERVGAAEIIIGGANLGGGVCREVNIKTEAKPVINSPSRLSSMQKPKRISNASDELDMTGFQSRLH